MNQTTICNKIVLDQWLKSGIMAGDTFFPETGAGTGGILSPTLCNITLNKLEEEVRLTGEKYIKKPTKIHLVRYADDFIITGPTREILHGPIMDTVSIFLDKRSLKLKDSKTHVVSIHEGISFLGFQIKRYQWNPKINKPNLDLKTKLPKQKTVLVIKPEKTKIQNFKSKIREIIDPNKPMEKLIKDLNPLIRGWAEYYRISYHGQKIFWKLGHWIYIKMMKWAKRKQPKRNSTWIVKKYVWEKDGIKWNFGIDGKQTIFNIATVTNLKLVPLKEGLNPYVSKDKEYFENRQKARIHAKFRAAIFKKAKHKCSHCNQTLYGEEPVELHHIVPEKDGGKWKPDNIIPLHTLCHQNITQQAKKASWSVEKRTKYVSRKVANIKTAKARLR